MVPPGNDPDFNSVCGNISTARFNSHLPQDCICDAPWQDSSNLFSEARLFDVAQHAVPGRNARIETHDGARTLAALLHVYAVLSMP